MKSANFFVFASRVLIALTLIIFAASLTYAGDPIIDDFNMMNSEIWYPPSFYIGSNIYIGKYLPTNGELKLSAAFWGGPTATWVQLKTPVVGNFIVQVDYKSLNLPIVNNEPIVGIFVNSTSKEFLDDPQFVGRGRNGGALYGNIYVGSISGEMEVDTTDMSGTLRFTRAGNVASAYYLDKDSKGWILLDQGPSIEGDLNLALGVGSGDASFFSPVSVAFDNFSLETENLVEHLTQDLATTVFSLNLQQGIANSLNAKLQKSLAIIDDLNGDNSQGTIGSLNAFINQVNAQRGKKISNTEADILIAQAQEIIAFIASK
jgi:hypothetical protein